MSTTEIEYKFDAEGVSIETFQKAIRKITYEKDIDILQHKVFVTKDTYRSIGGQNLRLREKEDTKELTVKQRKDKNSTKERLEATVTLIEGTDKESIAKFLNVISKQEFRVTKYCQEYLLRIIDEDGYDSRIAVVMYRIFHPNDPNKMFTFIEVELGEGGLLAPFENFTDTLRQELDLGEPMNKSIYEMFKDLAKHPVS